MQSKSILPLAAAVAALLAAPAAPPAGAWPASATRPDDTPSRPYRDPVHKFSFKMFPEWQQVPVEITEKYKVAAFYEGGDRGDAFSPELEVYRIDKRSGPGGPTTGVDPKEIDDARLRAMLEAQLAPKSVFDLAFSTLIIPDGQKNCDPADFKKITSYDKVDGKLWTHEIARGRNPKDRTTTLLVILAAFEKDGIEYGLRMTGPARRDKFLAPNLKRIAQSFVFFDDKAKEVVDLDKILDGVNVTPKRRGEIEKGMVKGWGIEVSPKKNYVVIYNTKNNKNLLLAREIAQRIEGIREQIYEVQFPPSEPVKAVSIVRVCGDRDEYHKYGGPGGSAGYWNSWAEELVFYDASPAKKIDDDTLSVLYHEAFHQYIYYSVGNVAPHSWFNEGHGDYYAGAKYLRSRKWDIGPFDWRVGTVKNAIRQGAREFTLKQDEQGGKERKVYSNAKGYTPLADLVAFSQRDYYSYPGVSYAQGWSLIYFLREEVGKNPKKYPESWGRILDTYFDVLKREVAKEGRMRRGGLFEPPDGPDEPEDPADPADPSDPGDPAGPDEPADPTGPGGDDPPGEETVDPGFQPMQEGEASESALEIALREAFTGVDFAELEKAWAEFTLRKV